VQTKAARARYGRRLLRLAIIAIVVVGFVLMLRGLALRDLAVAVAHARLWPIVAASAIAIGVYVFKALSWRIMMEPRFRIPVVRLLRYTIVAYAVSAITPARAGEAVRVWLLNRRDNVDTATSVAVATSEKVLDAVSLLVLAAPLPWLLPLPAWVEHGLCAMAGLVAVGAAVAVFASARIAPSSWFGRFLASLERRPRELGLALALLLVGWVIDLGAVILVLYAVGISAPWSGALLVMVVVNVVIALPSTPAHVGTFELGALVVLVSVLHIPKEPALSFAVLYHATQSLPTVVLGFVLEWRLLLSRGPMGDSLPHTRKPEE
jgi:glycosyltransferase 2 family protein